MIGQKIILSCDSGSLVLRKNRTIDWRHKESARAQMRVMIKRLLKKYKYPPEGAEEALQIVMAQCDNWAENEEHYIDE